MQEKIDVVVFGTNKHETLLLSIKNTLKSLQTIVDGYIETTSVAGLREHGIVIICNNSLAVLS